MKCRLERNKSGKGKMKKGGWTMAGRGKSSERGLRQGVEDTTDTANRWKSGAKFSPIGSELLVLLVGENNNPSHKFLILGERTLAYVYS